MTYQEELRERMIQKFVPSAIYPTLESWVKAGFPWLRSSQCK